MKVFSNYNHYFRFLHTVVNLLVDAVKALGVLVWFRQNVVCSQTVDKLKVLPRRLHVALSELSVQTLQPMFLFDSLFMNIFLEHADDIAFLVVQKSFGFCVCWFWLLMGFSQLHDFVKVLTLIVQTIPSIFANHVIKIYANLEERRKRKINKLSFANFIAKLLINFATSVLCSKFNFLNPYQLKAAFEWSHFRSFHSGIVCLLQFGVCTVWNFNNRILIETRFIADEQ